MELFNSGILEILAETEPSLLMGILSQVALWLKVAIGIGLVIFVHELGHFVAAKSCGVKCEKFYVGFDVPISIGPIKFPRTLGKFQWGETEYGLGIIPLGGYVKMLGQDDDPRKAAEEAERIRIANENNPDGDPEEPQYVLDPRSFQAKTVFQRMVIISSGVIVNIATAVLFAAAAFWYGVPYTPAVIGATQPGDPAWVAGIEPGSQIVSIGTIEDNDSLQFRDMQGEILEHGLANSSEPIKVKVIKNGQDQTYELIPTRRYDPEGLRVLIGVAPLVSSTLGIEYVAFPGSAAAEVLDDSLQDARVITIDGTPLPAVGSEGDIHATEIIRAMQHRPSKPIRLTFELAGNGSETKEVTVPPQPLKTIGATFEVGPITALVKGGSAENAGLKISDKIIGFDGQEVSSATALRDLALQIDMAVEIVVERDSSDGAKEQLKFVIEPTATTMTSDIGGMDFSLGDFGIAFAASNRLASIMPGSPLGETFQPGDSIERLVILWKNDEEKQPLAKFIGSALLDEPWDIDAYMTVPMLISNLQFLPPGVEIRVLGKRKTDEGGSKVLDQVVQLRESDQQFWPSRGLRFQSISRTHVAESFAEACVLGYHEAIHRGKSVFRFLKMLFTGKLNAKLLGGPVAIFTIAGSHAAEGIPRLLMFLTFLSINLAILNFLPIPALDGGHMVFLMAEAVLGRPVNEELQAKLTMIGVLLLLGLMVFAFYNDISRLAG